MKNLALALFATSFLLLATSAKASGGETVCTPVYGMTNSCAEHAVVDTGFDTSTLMNASALSYVLGLAAFIKAKHS